MSALVILGLAIAAAVPVIAYLWVIWFLDRYEREPGWLVGVTFGYGAVGGVFFGVVGSVLVTRLLGIESFAVQAALVAPLTEEPAKAFILFLLLASRHFDNTTDGLVYGAATGLGFAMTENFFYFLTGYQVDGGEVWSLILIRGLFTALMHSCASATFGGVLGHFRHRSGRERWLVAPMAGFGLAFTIHTAFNGGLVLGQSSGITLFALGGLALVPILGTLLFVVTQMALRREHQMLQRELAEEAQHGLLPGAHVEILPYWLRRRRPGWLHPAVDRSRYVRAATKLAFRKHQTRIRTTASEAYHRDIASLRAEIAALLRSPRGV